MKWYFVEIQILIMKIFISIKLLNKLENNINKHVQKKIKVLIYKKIILNVLN